MNSSHPCMIGDLLRSYCGNLYHCTFQVDQIQLDTYLRSVFFIDFCLSKSGSYSNPDSCQGNKYNSFSAAVWLNSRTLCDQAKSWNLSDHQG